MSDWLSIIIVVLIVAIVLDGIRRARNSKRSQVRLSKNARKADRLFETENIKEVPSEFPSGGARKKDTQQGKNHFDNQPAPEVEQPQQASLDLEDPVPMLMESIEEQVDSTVNETHLEPSIGTVENIDELEQNIPNQPKAQATVQKTPEPEKKSTLQKAADYFNLDSDEQQDNSASDSPKNDTEEILVINIMSKQGQAFWGAELLQVLTDLKLKFGQMGIFHRHLDDDGDAPSLFSIANIIEPGVFDLTTIESVQTPGLCMFLPLPSAVPAIEAYENLIATAREIAYRLDGELKDENRSALTNQTIEHGRQRVLEFERKYKLHK